ncbi:UDP-glucose 4-epimerase GalE [Maribius pontilimi]|uniref:UDP-glucose 4-epimerase n=1 Tax=Palleronia pontilimi TaxID=1964209 RepID=A0A934I9L6_9RHOB|nr:UDP-glucose 4-epimerase GalE [Palleronia pontilimi]MBJ3761601.1 UDP-glucose 4-epimerase GalE [Palleronia pontilimi]
MTTILVTGGAGYIGSHACKILARAGYTPVAVDDLSLGWRDAVQFGPFEQADLLNRNLLDRIFAKHKPAAVMHFAALSDVGESMRDPGRYWRVNVGGSLNLIEAAVAADCKRFVFSSTCATYGEQDGVMLDENSEQHPINAYGASKRAVEAMLENFGTVHGLKSVIFRYFNVAGASPDGDIGEHHRPETHLIPLMLDAIDGKRPALTIFGDDYDTPDGTCIRDYVHVMDLVEAHVRGLKWLQDGKDSRVFNLGTGKGFSVKQVVEYSAIVTNRHVPINKGPRRPGDATALISGSTRAEIELGWRPVNSTLETMIKDAWRWHQTGQYTQ